jgi:hypothetical protein
MKCWSWRLISQLNCLLDTLIKFQTLLMFTFMFELFVEISSPIVHWIGTSSYPFFQSTLLARGFSIKILQFGQMELDHSQFILLVLPLPEKRVRQSHNWTNLVIVKLTNGYISSNNICFLYRTTIQVKESKLEKCQWKLLHHLIRPRILNSFNLIQALMSLEFFITFVSIYMCF